MIRSSLLRTATASVGLTAAVAAAALPTRNARADDPGWPQFRGVNAAGVAADGMKLPTEFGPAKNLLWKTALPRGHSSPCIWGERIFVTSFDPASSKLETLCLDRRNGGILWRRTAPAKEIEKVHSVNSPAVATPASDGERVYVYFASCGLLCYDFDGKQLWMKPLPVARTTFGSGTSPIVASGLVLLNREFYPEPSLLAVRARTGEVAWDQPRKLSSSGGPAEGYATPVIASHDGVQEILINSPSRLAAYDLKKGRERWSVPFTSTACSTPVYAEGRVFVVAHSFGSVPGEVDAPPAFDAILKKYDKNHDGKISEEEFPKELYLFRRVEAAGIPGAEVSLKLFFGFIDQNKDGQISREEWNRFLIMYQFMSLKQRIGLFAITPGAGGEGSQPNVVWREQRALAEVPSPLYYRERIYMVRDGGIVSCLDAKSGRLVYRERCGAGGAYFSSPVAGDGKVYVASQRGVVAVLAAGDKLGVLARNDLNEPILATPALVDGKIYVRTEKNLYAFGK